MTVTVRCPGCRQPYRVGGSQLDRRARCQRCGMTFTLELSVDETGPDEGNARDIAPFPPTPLPPRAPTQVEPAANSPAMGDPVIIQTAAPKKLGRYAIRQTLGAGGMGIVYLAHDPHLDRLVALKVLPAELARDDERRKRFLREARSAAKLHHANAVTVYDVGVESGMVFIAMEYVDGGSLEKAVGPGRPMPCQEATRAIRDAAGGLAAAHEIGLVHRDVKPSNLLRTSGGVVKVADFGLARSQAAQTQLTQTGALMGTPAFMAPEQWLGQEADARTDLYSLVCTYYFLLTGQPPYEAESLASLGYQHHHQPFPDPRRIVPDIPEAVCQVLAKGAAKQAAERYPDAAVLVGALDGVLSGETATAARTDVPTPTPAAPPTEPTLIESPRPSPVTIPDAKLPAQPAAASRFGGRSFGRLVQDGIWRTVQRIDKLLARIAGEGNTLVHGFLRGACAGGLIVVVILLAIMPFVRSSVDEVESPVAARSQGATIDTPTSNSPRPYRPVKTDNDDLPAPDTLPGVTTLPEPRPLEPPIPVDHAETPPLEKRAPAPQSHTCQEDETDRQGIIENSRARLQTFVHTDGSNYFALSLEVDSDKPAESCDVVVLLDTSASQAGEYRADGIASLKALLAGLKAEDRVQLIAVDVNAVPLSEGFVRPAGDEISRALQRLEQRVPLGATDMEKALQSAAGAFEEGARRKAAVYIGDGINAATGFLGTESFDSVVSNLVQKRIPVSSHGIGPRVDVRVLNALAAQTGGRVVADWDKEGPEEAGAALAAAANAPVLWPQQDQVVFPGGFEVYPMQMPPLRTDRDTVLIGKYAGGQKGPFDVQATVSTPQGPKEVKWSVAPNPTSEDNAFLVQLVEMAQVDGGRSLPVLGSESLAKIRQEINAGVYTTSQLAAQVFNSGNLDDAERLAKATQQYDPGNPEALAILRAVAKKRGADATQPEALELLGPRVGPTEDRAFQQMIETETRKTIEIAHRTMEFAPELAVQNLKQQLETIIRTTGLDPDRVDQLVDQLQAAIRQARQRLMVKAYVDRGESRLSKKDYDGAIAEFSEAIRLQPDCVNAYYFRGLAWYDKRDYDRAIKDLDQAIRLQPNDAVAYSMRGAAWREKRDYDRAIKDGDQAIRLQPDSAVGYHLRGVAWYDKQDYDRAMKDFDEAIRLNPNNAKAYVWRGRTKRDAGDTKGAEADLARARQLGWEPP